MGYTKSIRILKLVQDHLDLMLTSETNLVFEADDANKLAYQIRSGIKAAQARKDSAEYSKYAGLQAKYIIRIRGTKVIAELRDPTPIPLKQTLSRLVIGKITDALGAIGILIEHKPEEVYFPNYDDELDILYNYSSVNNYSIIKHETGVTVTKHKNEVAEWTP